MEGVLDMFHNHRFKIGESKPPGLWITPDLQVAKRMIGHSGGIISLFCPLNIPLKFVNEKVYLAQVQNGKNEEMYQLSGIQPLAVYDYNGNQIR